MGIQKLLTAEHDATEVVKAAKDGRLRAFYEHLCPRPILKLQERHPQDKFSFTLHPALTKLASAPVLAFPEKVARLKQAKAEAEVEVAAYKQMREAQFQIFSQERMGDTGTHSKELAKQTEAELSGIVGEVQRNKKTVIDMLLKSVTTVG